MLEVRGVNKFFGDYQVLKDISFSLGPGEAAVLLGRNGAGKTTLLRCIAGILRYEGEVLVEGIDMAREPIEAKKRIGYLPQVPPVRSDVTGYELFNMYTELHGIDLDADEWFERFALHDAMDLYIDEYSGGMRQRLFLMMTIAHDPSLVLMDEPMNNLDSLGKKLLIDIINEMKGRGKSFLISVHRVSDFIAYADEILVVDDGRLLFKGPVTRLFEGLGISRIFIYAPDGLERRMVEEVGGERIGENRVVVEAENIHETVIRLVEMGVRSFFIEEPGIDVIIRRLRRDEDGL